MRQIVIQIYCLLVDWLRRHIATFKNTTHYSLHSFQSERVCAFFTIQYFFVSCPLIHDRRDLVVSCWYSIVYLSVLSSSLQMKILYKMELKWSQWQLDWICVCKPTKRGDLQLLLLAAAKKSFTYNYCFNKTRFDVLQKKSLLRNSIECAVVAGLQLIVELIFVVKTRKPMSIST